MYEKIISGLKIQHVYILCYFAPFSGFDAYSYNKGTSEQQ
jgi:hypothetical protein